MPPMSLIFDPTIASIPPENVVYRMTYPPGAAPPVHITPLNPVAFILRAALIHPRKLALYHADAIGGPLAYDFQTWAQRIQNLAYALKMSGIAPGDRVAVVAPNSPLMADAHHGILAARAVITPINYRLKKGEVDYILEHSEAKLILVDQEFAHLVKGARVKTIVSQDTGRVGDPYEEFLLCGRRYSKKKGWLGLELEPNEDANAALCYTSGTTGQPKGVMTTYRGSYLAAIANAYEAKLDSSSTYLWVLPMFHACGWTYPWAITFAFASQICMRSVRFPDIWDHFINSGVTHYCGAPTVQIGIVNAVEAKPVPRKIIAIIAGAAPTAHLIGSLEKLGINVTHVYGLTCLQTYGPFTRCYLQDSWKSLSLEDRAKLLARQGHAFATADDLRVVYKDTAESAESELRDVPSDGRTLGEIVTRGNIVMKEYFKDPQATSNAFKDGYFSSGDLAVQHPDGSVAILDRSKDLLISGGENASSLAIEQELATHPDILEVAVVAREHPKWGERAMAFVVLHSHATETHAYPHSAFKDSLMDHAKTRLPGFARPEWIEVVKELPKTSTGKIQKNVLRDRVRNESDGTEVKAKL